MEPFVYLTETGVRWDDLVSADVAPSPHQDAPIQVSILQVHPDPDDVHVTP